MVEVHPGKVRPPGGHKVSPGKAQHPRQKLAGTQKKIQTLRKTNAVSFFLSSMDKRFWYFPSDSINKKIYKIETLGNELYKQLQAPFKKEFLKNSSVEEAVTSAIHEGANSTRSQAKALIASRARPKNKDEQMLLNNFHAMEWIKENSSLPISNELILKIHQIVSKDTLDGDDANFCGKFRDAPVYIATHEGPSHQQIEKALEEATRLITNHPRFVHRLIQGILAHYFIAYIHPFFDGNGRTARALFYFQTMRSGLKFVELLSISANLKTHGKRYARSFDLVKEHDLDMTFFIDFCLDSLVAALEKVERKIVHLMDNSKFAQSEGLSVNQGLLLQRTSLNKHRGVTIEEYAKNINKSREVARKDLKDLAGKGLLREKKQGKKFVYHLRKKVLKEKVAGSGRSTG